MRKFQAATVFGLACGLAFIAPTPSFGALIDGSKLNISGDGNVGATFLNWLCVQPGDTACATAGPDQGDFAIAGSTGSFAQYNGTFGLATDINNASQPLNAPFSLPNFIVFDLNNDISIELTFIPLGTDTISQDCAGLTHCTPQNALLVTPTNPLGLSAFNLDENATGTAAVFGIRGLVHQAGGDTANLSGTYTAQFDGLSPEDVLIQSLAGANSTYSANLSLAITAVPEPTTMMLSGIGLLLVGFVGRRYRRT